MPRVSRWLIHASLVYLALGFTLGALLLWSKGLPLDPVVTRFLPAHIEFLLVGWTIQLVMGVATWIFPRFGVRPSPYGSEAAAWAAFALLNAGVCLAAIGPCSPGAWRTRCRSWAGSPRLRPRWCSPPMCGRASARLGCRRCSGLRCEGGAYERGGWSRTSSAEQR